MENIIKITEEKIKSLDWDIDYHTAKLSLAKEQKIQLELELATLKVKLGQPTKGHEHNSFQQDELEETAIKLAFK